MVRPSFPRVLPFLAWFVLSTLATLFPIVFARLLWPDGLTAGAETLFWPATGINLAGLLLLGPRFGPWLYGATVVGLLLAGRTLGWSLYSSLGNGLEAMIAWAMVVYLGKYQGRFDELRPVVLLLAASLFAPLASSLTGVAGFVHRGIIPAEEFAAAVLVWTLANGASILILTPFCIALHQWNWSFPQRPRETLAWLLPGMVGVAFGLKALLSAGPMNFAFLAFPFTIYAAIRFGLAETSAALFLVMASIYWALSRYATPPAHLPPSIWFVQTFCWVLAAMALIVVALVRERHDAQSRALEASLREERAHLAALRYQMNPHFLFNTLNSLRATLPGEAETSREMVTELAGYLRSTLHPSPGDFAPLQAEIESVSHYLAIEQIRFGNRLELQLDIAPHSAAMKIPVFLLQPLVENAVMHGFRRTRSAFKLIIRTRANEQQLQVEVANTGTWQEPAPDREGIGLANIRQRLSLLYGPRAELLQESSDGWVRMMLTLPVHP